MKSADVFCPRPPRREGSYNFRYRETARELVHTHALQVR